MNGRRTGGRGLKAPWYPPPAIDGHVSVLRPFMAETEDIYGRDRVRG